MADLSTPEGVYELYRARETHYLAAHTGMRAIERIYDNQENVRIPDLRKDEASAVPNLLRQGVDQMAGRVASVVPQVFFASDKPGQRTADRRAAMASRVIGGWWETDGLPLKMHLRARHLIAYGMSPAIVSYDPHRHAPMWTVRRPTECYPSVDLLPGTRQPSDVIFSYRRPYSWLKQRGYGPQVVAVTGRPERELTPDMQFTLLEYVDPERHTLYLTSATAPDTQIWATGGTRRTVVLENAPNLAGVMTASVPSRLTLSRNSGQFDAMIAMYTMQAKLMSLDLAGIEKGIFPDTYLISRPGEQARFIKGPFDGRTGNINEIVGGDIKQMDTQPGYRTDGMIDRLERSQRLTAGIPSEFGGESATNIRTGRRGDQVLAGVIDFPVAEAQEVFAAALNDENKAAIALAKHYDGRAPRSIYVGTGNQLQKVTYISKDVFVTDQHKVSYPVSGADVNTLTMIVGQLIGMGLMSKESGAELNPFIDNPETEHDRIIAEGLEQALIGGIQQQAAAGAIPPLVLSKVMTLVRNDKMELAEALTKVTEDAAKAQQEQEAQMGAPPTAEQAMAPAAQAAMAGASAIPGANESQQSLSGLLTALRKPAMAVADRTGTTDSRTGRPLL